MKKVLIITYYWPPSGGAGVQRWLKFVKYLPAYDVQPFVLTVDEQEASYPLLDESFLAEIPSDIFVYKTKTAEPFGAYKKITGAKQLPHGGFANEQQPTLKQRLSRFVRGNFFIPDPRRGWNFYAYSKAVELIKKYDIQTVVTTSPPHSTQLIGLRLKKELGIRWIADLRDPWTDIYYYHKLYHTWPARKLDKYYEQQVLKHADNLIVVSKDIKRLFAKKLVGAECKIAVVPNGYDHKDFENLPRTNTPELLITYTGTITNDYHINGFITALQNIKTENSEIPIKVRFVGSITPEYAHTLGNLLGVNFEHIAHVPHSRAIQYMAESSVLLLGIPDMPNNHGIITGKLFEYLAIRKPILGIGPVDGDAAQILHETALGNVFDYVDVEGMKQFLLDCYTLPLAIPIGNSEIGKYSRKALAEQISVLL